MSLELFDLHGKRALVTGGARGIGLACAESLAEAGASLVLVDRLESELMQAVSDCRRKGFFTDGIVCDVSSHKSVDEMIEEAVKSGPIDIFINSAAITNRKPLLAMSDDEWDRIVSTNLYGAFYLGRAVGDLMVRQGRGGKIIYIVSTGAYRASVNFGAYSASKAGVVMLMKTLALELAPHGILCNAIAPTATDTQFTAEYYAQNPDKKEAVIRNHPLGRIAVPADFKGTALYLASAASNFVTGTTIVVDGGKTAK